LQGRVVDVDSGVGVPDVVLRLREMGRTTLTNSEGRFSMQGVAPGEHALLTNHLAYRDRSVELDVPEGSVVELEMALARRAIVLPPVKVEIERISLPERAAGGIRITRDEIERVRHLSRDIGDFLSSQHIPGVIVRRRGDGSLCIGSAQGQVRMMNNPGCVPMLIFVNGARTTNSDLALRIPPDAVDRITIYKPVDAGTLFGMGSGNGVLMIYTKGN